MNKLSQAQAKAVAETVIERLNKSIETDEFGTKAKIEKDPQWKRLSALISKHDLLNKEIATLRLALGRKYPNGNFYNSKLSMNKNQINGFVKDSIRRELLVMSADVFKDTTIEALIQSLVKKHSHGR